MKKGCFIVELIIISCFFLILSSDAKENKGETIRKGKAIKEPLLIEKEKKLKGIDIPPLIPEKRLTYTIKSYEEVDDIIESKKQNIPFLFLLKLALKSPVKTLQQIFRSRKRLFRYLKRLEF